MKDIAKNAQRPGLDPDTLAEHVDRVHNAALDKAANVVRNHTGSLSLEEIAQQIEALKQGGGQ